MTVKDPLILSDADRKALAVIENLTESSHHRTFTCTELGERLFSGFRKPQCYARPAGKVVKRLIVMGFVRPTVRGEGRWRRSCFAWTGQSAPEPPEK